MIIYLQRRKMRKIAIEYVLIEEHLTNLDGVLVVHDDLITFLPGTDLLSKGYKAGKEILFFTKWKILP